MPTAHFLFLTRATYAERVATCLVEQCMVLATGPAPRSHVRVKPSLVPHPPVMVKSEQSRRSCREHIFLYTRQTWRRDAVMGAGSEVQINLCFGLSHVEAQGTPGALTAITAVAGANGYRRAQTTPEAPTLHLGTSVLLACGVACLVVCVDAWACVCVCLCVRGFECGVVLCVCGVARIV